VTAMKLVYSMAEGGGHLTGLLGGKGARLAEMKRMGLRVPDGFTLTTAACRAYYEAGQTMTDEILGQLTDALRELEQRTGKRLGDPEAPLLLAVRSGAVISMPGMMDTILNLGLNDAAAKGLAKQTGDVKFADDCYRRFREMYSEVVLGSEPQAGSAVGGPIPEDPREQLIEAVKAVFASWNNRRAAMYRKINGIPADLYTAVTVQEMVFGNLGSGSATGVVFTRNPSNGAKELYGEYLAGAQGEDIVAGSKTPRHIGQMKAEMPDVYLELTDVARRLEAHYQDMQEIEFTVQKGTLYLLQTRDGKRTIEAAVKIAVDLVQEGVLSRQDAVSKVDLDLLNKALHPRLDNKVEAEPLAVGLPAVPGAATGVIALDRDTALQKIGEGKQVLLVRRETDPNDYEAMAAAHGILTAFGGTTSHAAVTARPLGKPCIVGCEALSIDMKQRTINIAGRTLREGETLTLDGETGRVYEGELPLTEPELAPEFAVFRKWLTGSDQA
jgi:pyruvate,orthophosphate dikinase